VSAPPLAGVRVVEYAQYVAGPLCGVVLGDLGGEVVKVEPPAGDGYRYVMPLAPGLGRYFIPLNRGKRSVVLDLKTPAGRNRSAALVATADIVIHNYPPRRAAEFGLDWESVHAANATLVVGVVSSFGSTGPLAGTPAYDLVAQARSGLLTAHAGPGDTVPVRAGGIPLADLTAGYLLAAEVLAGLVAARASGVAGSSTSPCSRRLSRSRCKTSFGSRPRHARMHASRPRPTSSSVRTRSVADLP
jgi:crotonobetainyl-CoA:carnitine CoA-transferase CaiB-like acyl-CoA transferase